MLSSQGLRASNVDCQFQCLYSGHCDGVWAVNCARNGSPIFGTASADGTAIIWDIATGQNVLQYSEHAGSVNDITFHPTNTLVCTASGDFTTHIWNYSKICFALLDGILVFNNIPTNLFISGLSKIIMNVFINLIITISSMSKLEIVEFATITTK